ncbi:transposase [Haloferula sp. BvORR071]|uniref:transposase n=1 Tax=Haloferula sp. BvORR071 TaxID=1396141 RepID=UPI00054EF658|nr:transposase [Haloferula sp. BvORR071]
MAYPRPPISWPRAPEHRLGSYGTYFVTAGTYLKAHRFRENFRLEVLHRGLLAVAAEFGWTLEAWSVFSNHYHFIGVSPPGGAGSLPPMLGKLHMKTSKWINRLDDTQGRKVWHNFRETLLTFESSYFARLNYVHRNAEKHGLVRRAEQYPWCSAGWFAREATSAQQKTIAAFPVDRVKVYDEYAPVWQAKD